jgi:hypothetical protein
MTVPLIPASNKSRSPKKEGRAPSSYLQYTSLSFQMMAIIGAGVWLGMRLDTYLQPAFPVFLSILAPTSTAYAVYAVIKRLSPHSPKNT